MNQSPIKIGLLAVIILQIGVLFFMLRVYDDFVSSPENYYKNILVKQAKADGQSLDETSR